MVLFPWRAKVRWSPLNAFVREGNLSGTGSARIKVPLKDTPCGAAAREKTDVIALSNVRKPLMTNKHGNFLPL